MRKIRAEAHKLFEERKAAQAKRIEEIKKNPIARKVKLADLSHNSDPTRLPPAEDEDEESWRQQRMEKYRKAIAYLTGE